MANTSASGGYLTPTSAPLVEDDALDDIFSGAIAGITGLAGELVRPKWQKKPPKRPASTVNWCAFGVTEDNADAGPVIAHDPDADEGLGQDTYTRHKDITVIASFYGPAAKGVAQLLEDGIAIPQNLEELQLNSICFISAGTIRAVPESVNMQWLDRYDLLLYFRRAVTRTYAVQNILTAGVELNADGYITEIIVEP